jgi:hypothetical protein
MEEASMDLSQRKRRRRIISGQRQGEGLVEVEAGAEGPQEAEQGSSL